MGYEFRENMPEPIRILEAELNQKAQRGNDLEIQNRVEEFRKKINCLHFYNINKEIMSPILRMIIPIIPEHKEEMNRMFKTNQATDCQKENIHTT